MRLVDFSTYQKNVDRHFFIKSLINANKIAELTRVVCDGYEWRRIGEDMIKTIRGSAFKWNNEKHGFWLYDESKKEFYAHGWSLILFYHEYKRV